MDEYRSYYREVHLDSEYWANIPDSMNLRHQYYEVANNIMDRKDILGEIVPYLYNIIAFNLTSRQQEIMILRLVHKKTQVQIANELRITQPTVNQHIIGKIRQGKRIGGAIRKIRKNIQRRASRDSFYGANNVLSILCLLLHPSTTRRQADVLLKSLR